MPSKKQPSEFSRKFIQHCDKEALEMAGYMIEELKAARFNKSKADQTGLLAFMLSDALVHFFYNTLKLYLSDPQGAERFRKIVAASAGRVSDASRWNKSVKQQFLIWAFAENERNPGLSKNAMAERYAREHPGVSVSTLRRYLAAVPREGED